MKGAGTNHGAWALSRVSGVPAIVHLIEVNFTFGTVLVALFLRKFNVLPHVMRLNDPVRNGVHGFRRGLSKVTVHLGEQEAESLERLFFGAGKPLDSVPVTDERALVDPVAFWGLVHHVDPRHSLNQSGHIEVFLLFGDPKRDAFCLRRFSGAVLIGVILLRDLCAAGGITPPLGFSIPQKVKDFIAETGYVLL